MEELGRYAGTADCSAIDRLLSHFNSLSGVLAAPSVEVRAVAGEPHLPGLIDCVRRATIHALRLDVERRALLGNETAVLDYLRCTIGDARIETLIVFHLDAKNFLLHEQAFPGTINEVPIYIREILKRALYVGAAGIIMAHNHPSGDAQPSEADRTLTKAMARSGRELGVWVLDHLIVSRTGTFSFRLENLL